jgi:hypothetical protein
MIARRVLLAFVLTLLMAVGLLLPACAAETVRVRAAEHDKAGFGRIAFDWPAPVTFDARIDGTTLIVHFARRFTARFDAVKSHLDDYVSTIRVGDDGTSIVAQLKRPATLHSFADGNTIAIDIVAARPQAAPARPAIARPATAKPTPAAALKAAAVASPGEAATVGLRFGEHPGFRRVVFDWPDTVPYALAEKDGTVRLRFGHTARLDVARLAHELPDLSPRLEQESGATVLSLVVPAGASFRHFRSGNSIVLDVLGHVPAVAAKARGTGVTPPPELIEPAAGTPEAAQKPPLGAPRPLTRPSSQASPPPGSLPVHYALAP